MKKLCVGVLCLLMAAGLLGCGVRPAEDMPETAFEEEVFTQAVTKIDLSAPESQKYREWLEAYWTNPPLELNVERIEPSSTEPKTNKPAIRTDDYTSYLLAQEGFVEEESWKTWNWDDAWELELYCYKRGWVGWYVLRARNKVSGETQLIDDVFNDASHDFWSNFEVLYIDETYVIYRAGEMMESWWHYFYALGQEEAHCIGRRDQSGFLNEERTKWWHMEHNDDGPTLHYTDLQKLAAGDADAQRELSINETEAWFRDAWLAERGGRSVICFFTCTYYPDENENRDPYYLALYDPLDGRKDYLEVPLGWLTQIKPSRFYLFYMKPPNTFRMTYEELDLSTIDFYIINLDI